MEQHRVSVVIPAYNRAGVISRAIKSTLAQSHKSLDVIVVDDGSTDDTAEIVRSFQENDTRIRYLRHSSNKGAQAARNTGARAATGTWIAFLDSDDYFLPASIERRLEIAQRSGVKVVHSECLVIRGDDCKLFGIPTMEGDIYRQVLYRPGPMFQGMLVAKDALESIGWLDESITSYQEWDSSIRLAIRFKFAFVSEPTFTYDCRGTDTISKDTLRDAVGYAQVVHKHFRSILRHCGPIAVARHYRGIAYRYRDAGSLRNYVRYMVLSCLWWPFRLKGAMVRMCSVSKVAFAWATGIARGHERGGQR
jgi:glycosyltransferase involved in cell wall biosynthesis